MGRGGRNSQGDAVKAKGSRGWERTWNRNEGSVPETGPPKSQNQAKNKVGDKAHNNQDTRKRAHLLDVPLLPCEVPPSQTLGPQPRLLIQHLALQLDLRRLVAVGGAWWKLAEGG